MLQTFYTASGIQIEFTQVELEYKSAIEPLLKQLDNHRGAIFASNFEYPGRYTCWDVGFYNPPLAITCYSNRIELQALNCRGEILLTAITPHLKTMKEINMISQTSMLCQLKVMSNEGIFSEEERSRQPSVFTILRKIIHLFKSDEEYLGLYGAFGYDLVFQFENLKQHQKRHENERILVLYLPDEIFVVNHRKEEAFIRRYDFKIEEKSTEGLSRTGKSIPYQSTQKPVKHCDHEPGEYSQLVEEAKNHFAVGDLFEVVPSQTFYMEATERPSSIFKRMQDKNPSPYGFFINLGEEEYLVGASPEMYVRVQGSRVETCPISGTIKRGSNAIEDAINIQSLLESEKEASELTMCTDVDRNDKSRICEPGSVQVIGRRQIEIYSRVIHTVDHVEGTLRKEFDAIDAFLTHMWVVTVTGAPKLWAMNFIEQHEKSSRRWYGGAIGWFNFNGNINTGLVLRTFYIKRGVAEIRAGATLLFDSDASAEEAETRIKASAFIELFQSAATKKEHSFKIPDWGTHQSVLLIDHQDSFVHTLANYFRQTGAKVQTVRFEHALNYLNTNDYNLVCLSPGPGKPTDFQLSETIGAVNEKKIPLFGVCLGLQGIVEYFGGKLDVLDYPVHGKSSLIKVSKNNGLFNDLGESFVAGRYHSLYANPIQMPQELDVTAITEDGVVMAVSHHALPIHAVQFHPETILSLPKQAGLRIISNLMRMIKHHAR